MSEKSEATTSNPLTSSVGDSPVRTSATPASEQASKANGAGCGPSSIESFANYDRDTCSWRTSELCLFGGWIEFSETWPMAGMMRNGIAYRRQPLVPRISDIVCSYSPDGTEQAPDAAAGIVWPTPDAMGSSTLDNRHCYDRIRPTLGKAAIMWPTPKSSPSGPDYARTDRKDSGGDDLATAAARFPTPQARDWKGQSQRGSYSEGAKDCLPNALQSGGQLNPTWVEWLMGFPLGWTDLEDSATPSSHKSPNGSADE